MLRRQSDFQRQEAMEVYNDEEQLDYVIGFQRKTLKDYKSYFEWHAAIRIPPRLLLKSSSMAALAFRLLVLGLSTLTRSLRQALICLSMLAQAQVDSTSMRRF